MISIEYHGQIILITNYRVKGNYIIVRFGNYEIRLPKEVLDGYNL